MAGTDALAWSNVAVEADAKAGLSHLEELAAS